MSDEVSRRNAATVFQSLGNMEIRLQDAMIKIDAQNQTIASINSRVTELETTINRMRISNMGTGPTEK